MKRILLVIAILSIRMAGFSQTAVNFIGNDCAGTAHNLFTELDAGNIIVLSFVMPCVGCIAPAQNALYTAQSFGSSYPGRVVFYVVDDDGGTPCSTLITWVLDNGMSFTPIFTDTAFTKFPYGPHGMPKTVVLAGADHKVIYVEDNTLDVTALQNAIAAALIPATVLQVNNEYFALNVFPNPATDHISVDSTLQEPGDVAIAIYDLVGTKVKTLAAPSQAAGHHNVAVSIDEQLSAGFYLLRLSSGSVASVCKFFVAK
jgi:hypothetical protein